MRNIKFRCLTCPPFTNTRIRALLMAFSDKTDQIRCSASLTQEVFLTSIAACDRTPVLPPNVTKQWIEVE